MLQKEFEERIGRSVSEEEYVEANAMYELAGDEMDKDVFCREWEEIGASLLVRGLFDTAHRLRKELQEEELVSYENCEIISDAADAILEIADGLLGGETAEHTDAEEASVVRGAEMITAARELVKTAWWLVGQKEVTRRKVAKGYRLDDKDRETIINKLTK